MKIGFSRDDLRKAVDAGERKRQRRGGTPDLAEDLGAQIAANLGGAITSPARAAAAKSKAAADRREELLPKVVDLVHQREPAKCIATELKISERKVVELKALARTRGLLPPGRRRR